MDDGMKQIRLSKGLFTLVNAEDYDWLMQWKWCASLESRGTKFYAVRFEGKKKMRMHVEIVKRRQNLAEIPQGMVVDHVNDNSLDNRYVARDFDRLEIYHFSIKQQLEIITQTENMRRSKGWKKKAVKIET